MRAADLIGQLGDPHHPRKANALYYEFEEVGMNRQLGYTFARRSHEFIPAVFLETHSPHIQTAIQYLNVTSKDGNGSQIFTAMSSVPSVISSTACRLLVQSGHSGRAQQCPLLGK